MTKVHKGYWHTRWNGELSVYADCGYHGDAEMPDVVANGRARVEVLSILQFAWLPRRYQCGNCVRVYDGSWPVSADSERETIVESLVLQLGRLGQTKYEHRCYFDSERRRCRCGAVLIAGGWGDFVEVVTDHVLQVWRHDNGGQIVVTKMADVTVGKRLDDHDWSERLADAISGI